MVRGWIPKVPIMYIIAVRIPEPFKLALSAGIVLATSTVSREQC